MSGATHMAIAAGFMVMAPGPPGPPIVLEGGDLGCARCLCLFRPVAWSVRVQDHGAVCRGCALADPELRPWQLICDATGAMDTAYQAAAGQDQRDLMAAHLSSVVDHFNAWRYPESGGATLTHYTAPVPVQPAAAHDGAGGAHIPVRTTGSTGDPARRETRDGPSTINRAPAPHGG